MFPHYLVGWIDANGNVDGYSILTWFEYGKVKNNPHHILLHVGPFNKCVLASEQLDILAHLQ